jgi:hypothetical protein
MVFLMEEQKDYHSSLEELLAELSMTILLRGWLAGVFMLI